MPSIASRRHAFVQRGAARCAVNSKLGCVLANLPGTLTVARLLARPEGTSGNGARTRSQRESHRCRPRVCGQFLERVLRCPAHQGRRTCLMARGEEFFGKMLCPATSPPRPAFPGAGTRAATTRRTEKRACVGRPAGLGQTRYRLFREAIGGISGRQTRHDLPDTPAPGQPEASSVERCIRISRQDLFHYEESGPHSSVMKRQEKVRKQLGNWRASTLPSGLGVWGPGLKTGLSCTVFSFLFRVRVS